MAIRGLFDEGVFDAVGFAAELQQSAVVDDAINNGGGHGGISKYGAPSGEFQVGGQHQAAFLVAVRNDLE